MAKKVSGRARIERTAEEIAAPVAEKHGVWIYDVEYVKEGATVIDVGVHRIEDPKQPKGYRLGGDVKFDEVSKICEAITPVPGGTGAMTTACLLQNTLTARMKKL
jgi:methylenetetrahydrofolate dehydrogenase (NADP+)/methenyltetrahydrofolate cyclohydrolase